MPGIDANTKLMLHMNGSDGSTDFIDDSPSAHSPVANGDAQLDNDISPVFGSACGLFDGTGDYVAVPDSTDWDFGTNDMAMDCWVRFNSTSGNQCFIGRPTSGASYFYWALEGGGIRFRDFPSGFDVNFGAVFTFSVDTWYHIAVTRSGNDFRFFVDGVQKGSTITNSGSFEVRSVDLQVGANTAIGYLFNGHMDEVRISNGDSRWISNFTPPSEEYSEADRQITENLQISDSIEVIDEVVSTSENLQISDSILVTDTNVDAKFATKIVSINPLIFVTDTNPIEIVKVDTTDPENPTWEIKTIAGVSSAKDVAINSTNDFIYIAGNAGQVIKVEIADLTNQTIIDLSDTDDLLTIETNSNFGITYAGTNNEVGELYTIDERSTFSMDSDFRALSEAQFLLEGNFNIVTTFKMDSDFRVLALQTFALDTDFKCLTKPAVVVFPPSPSDPAPPPPPSTITPLDTIEPIKLTDFQVFIDSVELEDTDLILESISITHSIAEESRASFQLSRKHDQLNTTLEGVSSTITGQNTVVIKIQGITEFSGNISELDCQYNANGEFVIVNALADEKVNQFNNITMSLPGLNERLSLYDIMVQNPLIFNPVVDPDNEDNPKKFKGIRVDLGTEIKQSVSKWTISDSSGSIGDGITNGTWNPTQNWTYFWSPTVKNLGFTSLGSTTAIRFFYIGTSLAPVSEDLWELERAGHYKQRIRDDEESELGFYEVGSAPFQDISVRNGVLIAKPHLVDEDDRLSSIKDAEYNFIDYAKLVADLEYEKLKNINDQILPDTSCTFNITVDGYLYYDISLLTKMNVDNTTQSGIYQNSNGFPLSVKSITITSNDRKVSLQADNQKSVKELEELNSQFPDEDADEYNTAETRTLISLKTDMRTRLSVE